MAKTLIERLGFQDPEIGSPAHDDLILWIEQHAPEWIQKHIPTPPDHWANARESMIADAEGRILAEEKRMQEIDSSLERDPLYENPEHIKTYRDGLRQSRAESEQRMRAVEKELKERLPGETPPAVKPVYRLEMEHLLSTNSGFALGYVDLKAKITYPIYSFVKPYDPSYAGSKREPMKIEARTTFRLAAFEGKVAMPSLGELLRQLRFYQLHWGEYNPDWANQTFKVPYVVVCRDARLRETIERQGYQFWNPEEPL
jgi:hypothetical protein